MSSAKELHSSDSRWFLRHDGELAGLIGKFDWLSTPLGPIEGWPQSLKTTIALILYSPVPIVTLWGELGIMIYNDAYSKFAGNRHPKLLGSEARKGWPEVAGFNDVVMKTGLRGDTLAYKDQKLTLDRSGRPESAFMNLDYSPLLGEDGTPAGVMAIVVETTAKVRAEKRLKGESERLRQMFEQAPGFMAMMTGSRHNCVMANAAYYQLIGHRDILGKSLIDSLPEIADQGFIRLLDEVFATGKPFIGQGMAVELQASPGAKRQTRHVDFVYQPISTTRAIRRAYSPKVPMSPSRRKRISPCERKLDFCTSSIG